MVVSGKIIYSNVTISTSECAMPREWQLFVQEKVKANKSIPIPEDVLAVVGYNHEAYGPVIYWNYEKNAKYIILSNYPLREDNYVEIERTKIYDIDDVDDGRGRIKIPQALEETVKSYYFEGVRVNFLAHEEMVERDNPSVFLLPNQQLQRLLPAQARDQITESSETDEIRESLMDIPAFLSTP